MAAATPPWLDEEFLAKALQGGEDKGPKVSVIGFSVKMAVAPGNNYSSMLLRSKVEYREGDAETKTKSLIIKIPLTLPFMADMMERVDLFAKEPRIYSELLPRMKEKINIEFGPKSFLCPVKGLILEDLQEGGYMMKDRQKQLDYECCELALKTLAKFHATSVACFHDDPDFMKDIGQEIFYLQNTAAFEQFKPLFMGCMSNVAKAVSEVEGCKEAAGFIGSRVVSIMDSVAEIIKPRENGLNVLTHADFWISNMLFKHDDSGNAVGIKFIDFQVSRYASPALDLIYFIWSSSDQDVREKRINDLLKEYLDALNITLEKLGCPERMTVEDLKTELKRCVDLGLITICNMLPLVMVDTEHALNFSELSTEDMKNMSMELIFQEMMKVYSGERFLSILPGVVRQFYDWYNNL